MRRGYVSVKLGEEGCDVVVTSYEETGWNEKEGRYKLWNSSEQKGVVGEWKEGRGSSYRMQLAH